MATQSEIERNKAVVHAFYQAGIEGPRREWRLRVYRRRASRAPYCENVGRPVRVLGQ
jgi:hypothetical protein